MKDISAIELENKLTDGEEIHIIDVREDDEVASGKIPSAAHIRLGNLPYSLEKLDKSKHYYIVCHGGGRSAKACEFLISEGYDVTNMAGGMMAWEGEMERG